MPTVQGEATGVIVDLFANAVGFYASWGFSRSIDTVSARLITPAGNIDWASADACVAEVLVNLLAATPSSPPGLPSGVYAFAPGLFARVAVGQHFSSWAAVPGQASGLERLVLLRCHMGKRRSGKALKNTVFIQYRVWTRSENEVGDELTQAAKAWPLLEDLHAAIEKRLRP
jgi:hypothetical protein